MRDRLIERRPDVKPSDDQWMLDRWSSPLGHIVRVWYRELPSKARRYRACCGCGWRSLETDQPLMAECPLKDALDERLRRKRKLEHVVWLPLDKSDGRV